MAQAAVSVHNLPHVVVVGNEKGGSGKTTIALHLAVALMKAGQRVATVDLDSRQQSLTRCLQNRRAFGLRTGRPMELPEHFHIPRSERCRNDENEIADFAAFNRAIEAVQGRQDFLIIDTPPQDSYLMRLAHSMTDTLVTPLNDSFLDLDVIANIDPVTSAMTGLSHYGVMVREARRQRRSVDGVLSDWVVIRNRISEAASLHRQRVAETLSALALPLAFRCGGGLTERLVYRERVVDGLTALDDCVRSSAEAERQDARREVQELLELLRLPINERGRRRAAARAEWFSSQQRPLEIDDMLAPPSAA